MVVAAGSIVGHLPRNPVTIWVGLNDRFRGGNAVVIEKDSDFSIGKSVIHVGLFSVRGTTKLHHGEAVDLPAIKV